MNKIRTIGTLAAMALLAPIGAHAVVINEIRIDESGSTDANEYVELKGTPGESLNDVWYLVIGDHSNFQNPDQNAPNYRGGVVEYAIELSGFTIPDDGLFLIARGNFQFNIFGLQASDIDYLVSSIIFENSDNVTHLLVRKYTGTEVTQPSDQWGALAVDIDPTDTGELVNPLPWEQTIDAIGLIEIPNDSPTVEEFVYGELLGFKDIGPDGTFTPSHVYRGANDNQWNLGAFALINTAGDGLDPNAKDTPGKVNLDSPAPVLEPAVSYYTPTLAKVGETVTVVGSRLSSVTTVLIGAINATFSVVSDTELQVTIPAGSLTGSLMSVTNAAGTVQAGAALTVIPADAMIIVREDFEASLGDFTQQSVTSTYTWRARTFGGRGFAEMSGFGSDVASDDWLVSPAIHLTVVDDPVLNFTTARRFAGPDPVAKISTNYAGDVTTATWTTLTATMAPDNFYALTESGAVDLSAYAGQTVWVAIQYTSTGPLSGEGCTFQVHDFLVTGAEPPLWSTAVDLGDGWFDTWIGTTYAAYAPNYYVVDDLGGYWIYIDPSSTDANVYAYPYEEPGWAWSRADIFPWYFAFGDPGAWVDANAP